MNGKTPWRIWNRAAECMSRDELRALQAERLTQTVRYVWERVPMYAERMRGAGVSPEDIRSLEDVSRLPFTTKEDLRQAYPLKLTAVPREELVRIHGSSGTTGTPVLTAYTKGDLEIWSEMMARALTACGAEKGWVAQISVGYGLFTGGLGNHQGAERIGCTVIPMSTGGTADQIAAMQTFGTKLLCATPSYALHLAETMREKGLDASRLSLRAASLGAEPWTEEMRERIEALLGIDALNIYGLSEIAGPGVAYECLQKDGMHLSEDHVLAEIVDPETNEPLPEGETGELVLTTLTKRGMPLIRYRTRDLCRLIGEPCACGRTFRRLSRVVGRTDDMRVVRGVNVFPSQIEYALLRVHGTTSRWQLVIDRPHALDIMELRMEPAPDAAEDLPKRVAAEIKAVTGLTPKVVLLPRGALPADGVKLRRVIDLRRL